MGIKVGFIGLGMMGKGMANNLVRKGFDLTVFDVREGPVNELVRAGAKKASSSGELASATDVVFTMVRDNAQTEDVILGANGVLSGIRNGSTIIISSTVSPSLCQRMAREAAKKGVGVLDAPVSGGEKGANAGTLSVLVGGEESLFKKMEPVLQAVGKNIFYIGGSGMGEVAKFANNMVSITAINVTTEALAYSVKAGIPMQRMLDILKVSSGYTHHVDEWDRIMTLKKDHSPTSAMHLSYKDLKLGLEYAKEIAVDLPLITCASKVDHWRLPE